MGRVLLVLQVKLLLNRGCIHVLRLLLEAGGDETRVKTRAILAVVVCVLLGHLKASLVNNSLKFKFKVS